MEKTVNVLLNTIEKVKKFSNITFKHDLDVRLHSGIYVINAKSIMGIFSLDLSHALELHILGDDEAKINSLLKEIKEFIVK